VRSYYCFREDVVRQGSDIDVCPASDVSQLLARQCWLTAWRFFDGTGNNFDAPCHRGHTDQKV
jgi:hypothetical protein